MALPIHQRSYSQVFIGEFIDALEGIHIHANLMQIFPSIITELRVNQWICLFSWKHICASDLACRIMLTPCWTWYSNFCMNISTFMPNICIPKSHCWTGLFSRSCYVCTYIPCINEYSYSSVSYMCDTLPENSPFTTHSIFPSLLLVNIPMQIKGVHNHYIVLSILIKVTEWICSSMEKLMAWHDIWYTNSWWKATKHSPHICVQIVQLVCKYMHSQDNGDEPYSGDLVM